MGNIKKIDEINRSLSEIKSDYEKRVKESTLKVFEAFFAEYPEANTIYWSQGTPSWNDGDPCIFRIEDVGATWLDVKTLMGLETTYYEDKYIEFEERIDPKDMETTRFPELGNKTLPEAYKIDESFDTESVYRFLQNNSDVFNFMYGDATIYIDRSGNEQVVERDMD